MATKIRKLVNKSHIKYQDARKAVMVTVRKSDVKRTKSLSPDKCVLAKPIARAFPNLVSVKTFKNVIRVTLSDPKTGKPMKPIRYIVPKETARLIETFDQDGSFKPGKYSLEAPPAGTLKAYTGRSKKPPTRLRFCYPSGYRH